MFALGANDTLKNTLRWLMGEEPITHLGLEYYLEQAEVAAGY